jgi:hypothetical protein
METNLNNKIESASKTESTGFWHGGWAFLIFFVAIVVGLIGISYLVKMFM